jgi:hypothetical protein
MLVLDRAIANILVITLFVLASTQAPENPDLPRLLVHWSDARGAARTRRLGVIHPRSPAESAASPAGRSAAGRDATPRHALTIGPMRSRTTAGSQRCAMPRTGSLMK